MQIKNTQTGTLYIVATPIGNLEDITLRALRILGEVDLILCEDTRTTRTLLSRYEIKTSVRSFHMHTTPAETEKIVKELIGSKSIALVTDAGTPLISDPGVSLVNALYRDAVSKPIVPIIPIPGPSALTAALCAIPSPTHPFVFHGFVPHKKGRQTLIREILASEYTSVVYESTHRIIKLLEEFEKTGDTTHVITLGRELTKIHEEFVRGTATELLTYFKEHPDHVRGEFVVCIQKI